MAITDQDTFFSKLFETGMTDPKSKVYLPQILLDTKSPSLNPYTMDMLDLGTQKVAQVDIAVMLTGITINGIPNVSVSRQQGGSFALDGMNAAITAQFGKLQPPPPGVTNSLVLNSSFSLSFPGNQLTGKLELSIGQASLTAQIVLSGDQLINISTSIISLQTAIPVSATIIPDIKFDGGDDKYVFWKNFFANFIKKQTTIDTIVTRINGEINAENVRDTLGSELGEIFRNAIRQQLDPEKP
jgi:hypothetical protein